MSRDFTHSSMCQANYGSSENCTCSERVPSEPKIVISNNAISSVAASLANRGKGRSEEEKAYDELLKTCVPKPEGHIRSTNDIGYLFTVTTIASSQRYGGTRTPIICSSFDRAKEYVENNYGDLFECSYALAVIEVVVVDHLYNGDIPDKYWYKWSKSFDSDSDDDGYYQAIETPEAFKDRTFQPIG